MFLPAGMGQPMKYVFLNGSPNKKGNTARLAATLLEGTDYSTIDLYDYHIAFYGQCDIADQFSTVLAALEDADVIVMGAPMYWHSMSAAFRNFLDRSYGGIPEGALAGKDLYFVFQGAAPTTEQLAAADYTMGRYASLYGMRYKGLVSTAREAAAANVALA